VRLQRERAAGAEILYVVPIVRGAAQQAGALRFWIEKHSLMSAHARRSEARPSCRFRGNYPDESIAVNCLLSLSLSLSLFFSLS